MTHQPFKTSLARSAAAAAVIGLASAAALVATPAQASDAIITIKPTVGDRAKPSGPPTGPLGFALTSAGEITTFSLANPSQSSAKKITGIPASATIVGIDERPRTGALYAVVKNANNSGAAYIITPATGAATKAFDLTAIAGTTPGDTGPKTLDGTRFGVDFNPAADALRITSDTGQNLRALPSDRVVSGVNRVAGNTFSDLTLNYAGVTATGIDASAYTNNISVTATTALYNIDPKMSQLTLQNPPNDGTQASPVPLALNKRPVVGFDINTVGGVNTFYLATANNTVKATISNPFEGLLAALGVFKPREYPVVNLSTVNLATGELTSVGNFFNNTVIDIAVDTPAP